MFKKTIASSYRIERRVYDALRKAAAERSVLNARLIANQVFKREASLAEFVATKMALRALELRGVALGVVQPHQVENKNWLHTPMFYWQGEAKCQPRFTARKPGLNAPGNTRHCPD